jgi:hypothetical protein
MKGGTGRKKSAEGEKGKGVGDTSPQPLQGFNVIEVHYLCMKAK